MKEVIGIGVMLQTPSGTYLFQERDHNAVLHPGRIAPFGGGIEGKEDALECAKREMLEELNLEINTNNLQSIQLFESRHKPNVFIHMFLLKDVEKTKLTLSEGKDIVELSKEEAVAHENVTDFTKEILGFL
jgi:8-oxo-dGTP pyrophosphatase MutT (NUDIX family)